ncbi:MAG: radical SAM protein [Bacteroidales bacterium]|nr:radical SAM protein [Bacteroidales bacterium]
MNRPQASYRETYRSGGFDNILGSMFDRMESCDLCPRKCQVNRLEGETGICNTGRNAIVSSYGPHFGEEPCLVGDHGSGTIFFTHCNLLCNFCQNHDISHEGRGQEVSAEELADIMLMIQLRGCHNINFVTPSHVIPQMVEAVKIACEKGLRIPIVYNSGGYDDLDSIGVLEGVVDIYMPDFKFSDPAFAAECCDAEDYFEVAKEVLKEMHRQKGILEMDEQGLAYRGLLVRHLVMPDDAAGTKKIMEFLASALSADTYVNVMGQYHPCGDIKPGSALSRSLSYSEYNRALEIARSKGLHNLI